MRIELSELWVVMPASNLGGFDIADETLYTEAEAKALAAEWGWIPLAASDCLRRHIEDKTYEARVEGQADGREDAMQDRD